jgi:hypothetical protein
MQDILAQHHNFYTSYAKKKAKLNERNLLKLLFKLVFDSLILNSTGQQIDVQYLLTVRKLLKIPYLIENIRDLQLPVEDSF